MPLSETQIPSLEDLSYWIKAQLHFAIAFCKIEWDSTDRGCSNYHPEGTTLSRRTTIQILAKCTVNADRFIFIGIDQHENREFIFDIPREVLLERFHKNRTKLAISPYGRRDSRSDWILEFKIEKAELTKRYK